MNHELIYGPYQDGIRTMAYDVLTAFIIFGISYACGFPQVLHRRWEKYLYHDRVHLKSHPVWHWPFVGEKPVVKHFGGEAGEWVEHRCAICRDKWYTRYTETFDRGTV